MSKDLLEMQNGLCYWNFVDRWSQPYLFKRLIQSFPDLNDLIQADPSKLLRSCLDHR